MKKYLFVVGVTLTIIVSFGICMETNDKDSVPAYLKNSVPVPPSNINRDYRFYVEPEVAENIKKFDLESLYSALSQVPNLTLAFSFFREIFAFDSTFSEPIIWKNVTRVVFERPIANLECISVKDNVLSIVTGGRDGKQYLPKVDNMVYRFPNLQSLVLRNYSIGSPETSISFNILVKFISYFHQLKELDVELVYLRRGRFVPPSSSLLQNILKWVNDETGFQPNLQRITITFKNDYHPRIERLLPGLAQLNYDAGGSRRDETLEEDNASEPLALQALKALYEN